MKNTKKLFKVSKSVHTKGQLRFLAAYSSLSHNLRSGTRDACCSCWGAVFWLKCLLNAAHECKSSLPQFAEKAKFQKVREFIRSCNYEIRIYESRQMNRKQKINLLPAAWYRQNRQDLKNVWSWRSRCWQAKTSSKRRIARRCLICISSAFLVADRILPNLGSSGCGIIFGKSFSKVVFVKRFRQYSTTIHYLKTISNFRHILAPPNFGEYLEKKHHGLNNSDLGIFLYKKTSTKPTQPKVRFPINRVIVAVGAVVVENVGRRRPTSDGERRRAKILEIITVERSWGVGARFPPPAIIYDFGLDVSV
uniref:Uncharacterized protein n=1 Tax=Romanomermis culicivorax TaxID=13658 RepID=A0A915JRA2_ROMCU